MHNDISFSLNEKLDSDQSRDEFRRLGRIEIRDRLSSRDARAGDRCR